MQITFLCHERRALSLLAVIIFSVPSVLVVSSLVFQQKQLVTSLRRGLRQFK